MTIQELVEALTSDDLSEKEDREQTRVVVAIGKRGIAREILSIESDPNYGVVIVLGKTT